jgi:hypothetical protein
MIKEGKMIMRKFLMILAIMLVVLSFTGCVMSESVSNNSESVAVETVKPVQTIVPQEDTIDNYQNRIEYLLVNDAEFMDELESIGLEEMAITEEIEIAMSSNDSARLSDLCERGRVNIARVEQAIPTTEIGKEYSVMFAERWALGILVYDALEEGDIQAAVDYSEESILMRVEEREWLLAK